MVRRKRRKVLVPFLDIINMKYLKKYKIFEGSIKDFIPDNWVKLNSIGCVLDPNTGTIYPLLKRNGGYDPDGLNIEDGDVELSEVGEVDMKIINDLWLSTEPYIKDKIDQKVINTLKDLSLEYIDDGFTLYYYVYIGNSDSKPAAYGVFNHKRDKFTYSRRFQDDINRIKGYTGEILYSFGLIGSITIISKALHDIKKKKELSISKEVLDTLRLITDYDNIEIDKRTINN